jgi:hypothetical protein
MIGRSKPDANRPRRNGRRSGLSPRVGSWLSKQQWGMYGVGLAAAVLSFDQLWQLALRCGWPPGIAWLLPITLDAYAIDLTRRWLRGGINKELRRWAGWLVWAVIAISLAGNVTNHALDMGYLTTADGRPQWWIVVIVGAVPTVMLALLIHIEAVARSAQAADSTSDTGAGTAEPSKRGQLLKLLDKTPPAAGESNYKAAQRLGPQVGLNVQTASRYVREWRKAQESVARLGSDREAVS